MIPSRTSSRPSRPRPSGGSALADIGLTPNPNPGNDFEELVLSYLDAAYEINLQGEGFGTAIFGTCDNECSDLNFMLFSQGGRMVDDDTTGDDIPLVVLETGGSADRYTIRVDMVSCSIAPCYYALGVYRR